MASQFQKLASDLEKSLGLGGKKTTVFIERLSKNLTPILDNIETTILATKAVPFGLLQSMFTAYVKQIAKDAGISWEDLREASQDLLGLMREWFKPQAFMDMLSQLANFYLQGERKGEVDEFGLDKELVEAIHPFFNFLFYDYWRVSVKGIENIPEKGRCLLVSSHAGMLPYDGTMITTACLNEHKTHRYPRFLIEDFVYHFPYMGTIMSRVGAVRACPENATWLLKKGELVLVFPEGAKGLGKPFSERYQLKRFGRGGFIKLAIKNKAPIVPVAIVGSEEIHPIIWRSSILAKAMGVPYLPVTPTFPWLGPLGLLPLPTKWSIEFGPLISFDHYKPKQAEDSLLVQKLSEEIRQKIQKMINAGLKKRKSVWLG